MRDSLRDMGYVLGSVALAVMSGLGSAEPYKRAGVWFFGLLAVLLSLQAWRRRKHWSDQPAQDSSESPTQERVEFDEHEIRRVSGADIKESIRWDQLKEIGIVTTDDGPWGNDVFWMFMNADGSKGCAVSNSAEGFPALLARIQTLPGFDNEAVVQAMGSAANDRFVAWRAQ